MIKIEKCYKIAIKAENDITNIEISSDEKYITIEDDRSGFILIDKKMFNEFVNVLVNYKNEITKTDDNKYYRNMFATLYSEKTK